MAFTPTFNDWATVASIYGQDVADALQKNNVSLSQVGSTLSQANPGGFQAGVGATASADQINKFFASSGSGSGSGSGQQQQTSSGDPTKNPNYPTELLGAQALAAVGLNPNQQVTVNPSPSDTPMSKDFAKSGVSAVASPQTVSYAGAATPQTNVPSIFSPATAMKPSSEQKNLVKNFKPPYTPTAQANAAQMPTGGGTPFASVQPTAPLQVPAQPPAAPGGGFVAGIPQPGMVPGAPTFGGPNPTRPGLASARVG